MSDSSNNFDQHFLRLISRRTDGLSPEMRSLISRLIQATVNQHSCLDLREESEAVIDQMQQHPAFGTPDAETPFVFTTDRLYLRRYYRYEKEVASMIVQRNVALPVPDAEILQTKLNEHFGPGPENRQKLAALLAISRRLAIVTGGPGTGKTSTVVKMLDILLEETPDIQVRLAAPTGKAATRLNDSIRTWAEDHEQNVEVKTLHRLLGVRRDGRTWRHGPGNPVDADLLIIDEASMIDLPMMHRLLAALREDTRLILLGDPNQLPSVDTGNVLADLCAGSVGFSEEFSSFAAPYVGSVQVTGNAHRLTNAICTLERSYRFHEDSAIGRLALSIKESGVRIDTGDDSVSWTPAADSRKLLGHWTSYLDALRSGNTTDVSELLTSFEQARILCSRRGGEWGVTDLNRSIEGLLEAEGLKNADEPFYPGRPVLVTRNDYNLGIFNGDIGVCTPLGDTDYLVHFPGRQAGILASRLPEHETCFAMTVHQAQGSEFDHVMLVLGLENSEEASSLMTRELIYTAVTRARRSISIHASEETWVRALGRHATRISGMTSFLSGQYDLS